MSGDPADLSNLRDLALPAPVSWWPVPPGWWVLLGGAVVALAIALLQAWRRYQADAYRRAADRELTLIEDAIGKGDDGAAIAGQISELLKRVALTAYGREAVAGLSGAAWLTFLDRSAQMADFTSGVEHRVFGAIFDRASALDHTQLVAVAGATRRWIYRHRAPPPAE